MVDITAKVFGTLQTIRHYVPVLTTTIRRKLVRMVVIPMFSYCDVVFYNCLFAALKQQLYRCCKASLRFVHNIRCRESTAAFRDTILGPDLLVELLQPQMLFYAAGISPKTSWLNSSASSERSTWTLSVLHHPSPFKLYLGRAC